MNSDHVRAEELVRQCIAYRWPGAHVTAVAPVLGDASARRYLRCMLSPNAPVGAPPSVVVMLNDGSGAALSSDELGVFGNEGPAELPFLNVQRYLARLTDAIPAVLWVAEDQSGVVLEDVGDISLWTAARATGEDSEALFGRALDLIADLQRRATDDGTGCYAFEQEFDARLFEWEFQHFIEYGLEGQDDAAVSACRQELAGVARTLGALPRVFTHRDYHAWNIHVQDSRLRVIDFQDALLAPAAYDVASLLTDRTTPELFDDATERRLVARFAAAGPIARFGGVDPYEAFALCAVQRVLKVIGRFNYLAEVKCKPRYAELLPAVVTTARRFVAARDDLAATTELLRTRVKGVPACAR